LFGRRRMFVAGVMLFTIASLAGGFATSQAQLVAARVAQGVGGAIASPTALSLITSTFPEGPRRNKAMGVYAAMSGAGGALGLLLGDILTDLASWRWVLFVNVPIGLLVAVVAPRVLGESETRAGRLDLPGALLCHRRHDPAGLRPHARRDQGLDRPGHADRTRRRRRSRLSTCSGCRSSRRTPITGRCRCLRCSSPWAWARPSCR